MTSQNTVTSWNVYNFWKFLWYVISITCFTYCACSTLGGISIKKVFLDTNGNTKFNAVSKLLVVASHESNIVYALDKNQTYKIGVIVHLSFTVAINQCH